MLKKHLLLVYAVCLAILFSTLAIVELIDQRRAFESRQLTRFRNDMTETRRDVTRGIVARGNRYLAYSVYSHLPAGRYTLRFLVEAETREPGTYTIEVTSAHGQGTTARKEVSLDTFPAEVQLSLDLDEKAVIEPRIEYGQGNRTLQLKTVEIVRTGGLFPLKTVLFYTLVFSLPLFLLILTLWGAFKGEENWKRFLAGFLLVCGFMLIFSRSWVSEDAFITLRHVDNFLQGHGAVFNPGERVEGYTHATWFFILTLLRGLGISPYAALIIPGLLFSLLALWLIFFKIRFPDQKGPGYLGFAAAALIGISAFIDFGTSGLETGLSFFLLSLFVYGTGRLYLDEKPLLMGLLLTIMFLTRPDFGLFLILSVIFGLYKTLFLKRPPKTLLRLLLLPVLVGGIYELMRMGYYAAIFPNPFFTKSGSGSYWSQGLRYLSDFSRGSLFGVLVLLALAAMWVVFRKRRDALSPRLFVFICGLAYGFFVIRGGGDFMHGRFLLPATLLITLSSAGAFDSFFEKSAPRRLAAVVMSLGLLALSLLVVPLQQRGGKQFFAIKNVSDERHFYYKDRRVDIREIFTDHYIMMWKTMGHNWEILSRSMKRPMWVAHHNIGFMGYYAGPRVIFIDRLGLTDPVVSRVKMDRRGRPGHEKSAPLGYLLLHRMTVASSPFPLWSEVAKTPYGELWDLSHGILKSMEKQLPPDFKARLDDRITAYVRGLDMEKAADEADFLFFLKTIWLPYAPMESRQLFETRFPENLIHRHSEAYQWQETHRKDLEELQACLRSPMSPDRFFKNIVYALTRSLRVAF